MQRVRNEWCASSFCKSFFLIPNFSRLRTFVPSAPCRALCAPCSAVANGGGMAMGGGLPRRRPRASSEPAIDLQTAVRSPAQESHQTRGTADCMRACRPHRVHGGRWACRYVRTASVGAAMAMSGLRMLGGATRISVCLPKPRNRRILIFDEITKAPTF